MLQVGTQSRDRFDDTPRRRLFVYRLFHRPNQSGKTIPCHFALPAGLDCGSFDLHLLGIADFSDSDLLRLQAYLT